MTEQQIQELIRKYAEGLATPEEEAQLLRWYRTVPVEGVPWPSPDADEKSRVHNRILQRLQRSLPPRRARILRLSPLRAAVLLGVIIGAAALVYLLKPSPIAYTTITNPAGSIRQLRLPDSSLVWLNAATTFRYATDFAAHRKVVLDGEAFFEVTHDPSHPFEVASGGVRTTVLGTRFNIRGYAADSFTTVSLLSGRVSVAEKQQELAVLAPSRQLEWNRVTGKAVTQAIDTTAVVAWKAGQLQFQGQTLGAIMKSLERWYGVRIVFANPALSRCRYYMSFPNDLPLEQVLSLMAEITRMTYAFDRQTLVISGEGCP